MNLFFIIMFIINTNAKLKTNQTFFKTLTETKEYLENYLNLKFDRKKEVWNGNGFNGNFWIDELAEEELE